MAATETMAESNSEKTTKGPVFAVTLRGYARDEVDTHFAHTEKEVEHLRVQVRASLQEAEAAKLAAASAEERLHDAEAKLAATEAALNQMIAEMERVKADLESTKAERDAALERTANLDSEENAAREVLKAAHKTAEEMREQGRIDAQARVLAAEEHAQRVEAEARRKVKELEELETEMRARFERFLASARALASGFVREVDEARDKT